MKKILKITGIVGVCVVLILAITNPSLKNFKEYIGERSWEPYVLTFEREHNWIIFSTYKISYIKNDPYEHKDENKERELDKITGSYNAIFLNFFKRNYYYDYPSITEVLPSGVNDPNSPDYRDR